MAGKEQGFLPNDKPTATFVIVLVCSLVVNVISFLGSCLWVAPDTSYYAELAGGIADRLDFTSPLFLIRPPGYPVMLAAVFLIFGSASSTALLIVQHGMIVACAVLIAAMAWRLTKNRAAALAAGLMTAGSLQLTAYANVVMTEAPYTLLLIASLYCLVVYHLHSQLGWLGMASLLAGVSYLFRPIGMTLVPVCALAAAHRTWTDCRARRLSTISEPPTEFIRRGGGDTGVCTRRYHEVAMKHPVRMGLITLSVAFAPALAAVLPAMIQNKLIHGGDLSGRCADLSLYFRVARMDKLDSSDSAALNDIRAVVNEAIELGHLPPGSDYRLWGQVWKAYESVRGIGLTESSRIMGQAARDLIREHPVETLKLSAKYCYWMLMVPDSFYRFHPGGAPGIHTPDDEWVRDARAEIYDADTYEPMMRPWTGPVDRYLHLGSTLGPTTPLWTAINRGFYRYVETGPSLLGVFDSPYETFTALCLLSLIGSLATKNRTTWLLIAVAIGLQIGVSAVLAGPTPRYAVPVKPLLLLFPALTIGCVLSLVRDLAQRLRYRIESGVGSQNDAPAVSFQGERGISST